MYVTTNCVQVLVGNTRADMGWSCTTNHIQVQVGNTSTDMGWSHTTNRVQVQAVSYTHLTLPTNHRV